MGRPEHVPVGAFEIVAQSQKDPVFILIAAEIS